MILLLYMLSSLHLDLTFCQPSISPFPPLFSSPNPLSTHSWLPISLNLDRALANANLSSSPLNIDEFLSMSMFIPKSSMRLRITSEMASSSALGAFWPDVSANLPAFFVAVTASLSSDWSRNSAVRGTAVVMTNLAYFFLSH